MSHVGSQRGRHYWAETTVSFQKSLGWGGGILGKTFQWWGCTAGTLKPLAYIRPLSGPFCKPILDWMQKIPTLSQNSFFPAIYQIRY